MNTSGVISSSGILSPSMPAPCKASRVLIRSAYYNGMTDEGPAENPRLEKLKASRVQEHVRSCLTELRKAAIAPGCAGRDATAAPSIISIEWSTLDLYTIAVDLAEDGELRNLTAQARSMILRELLRRSIRPR